MIILELAFASKRTWIIESSLRVADTRRKKVFLYLQRFATIIAIEGTSPLTFITHSWLGKNIRSRAPYFYITRTIARSIIRNVSSSRNPKTFDHLFGPTCNFPSYLKKRLCRSLHSLENNDRYLCICRKKRRRGRRGWGRRNRAVLSLRDHEEGLAR